MIGIYLITNKLNNKVYVGQSINIEKRWDEHKQNAFNSNTHTYNYPLYQAMRKYGLQSFNFQVLEETDIDKLTEEEQYYINQYHSLDPNCGYNLVPAINSKRGENCNWAVLTDKETDLIYNLILSTTMTFKEIGTIFNISGSYVEDINKGRRRARVGYTYPLRSNNHSLSHQGSCQNGAILSELEVLTIRQRYVDEDLDDIYPEYQSRISRAGFKKIIYGQTWKHLPCYKKRLKQWVYPK